MGLSSKQVSIDGFDWNKALMQAQKFELPKLPTSGIKRSQQQNQIHPPEQLKCPRCDSTNTKFCYYNNYNKSQPRHFCRACKRHWTKGGTLRNVPVGGGRKNKRPKKSTTPSATSTRSSAAAAAASTKSNIEGVLSSQMSVQLQSLPLSVGRDQKNLSDILYQGLVFPSPSHNWPECENFNINFGILNSQNPDFSAVSTTSTSFETKHSPISTSFQSPNICNYSDQDFKPLETQPAITTTTSTRISTHPWQLPTTTSCGTHIPSCYWSWDEIDTFAATDLNIPWDDQDIKP